MFIAFSGRTMGWSVLCVHSIFWSYCGLVCVLYSQHFLVVLWVGLCSVFTAFSGRTVGWSVFCEHSIFWSYCGLVCALYSQHFLVVLWVGLCSVFIAFFVILWVDLCSVFTAFSGRTVGWSVFCVHSIFWSYCGLVCALCS